MGAPKFDENLTREIVINNLLQSIAMEEYALSHLVNAEGEKIQEYVDKIEFDPDQVIEFQKSVAKIVRVGLKYQMLLQFKLEDVLEIEEEEE